LPPLSFGGALLVRPWPRFHTPLIEPDRQICPTPIRDAANCGCPSFVASIGDQPMQADGPHRFRNGPFGRDVVQAPGGASGLSHSETRCAAFAGAGASSASTTCRFRESIPHPVQPLSTLRTPRCRDARKTRSRPACSALNGPDFHWQAHSSFPIAPRIRLSDKNSRFRVQRLLQFLTIYRS
jgi:hypothetical protein